MELTKTTTVKPATKILDLTRAIELEHAFLHEAISIPQVFNEKTLTESKLKGFKMYSQDRWVILWNGRKEYLVPIEMVMVALVK